MPRSLESSESGSTEGHLNYGLVVTQSNSAAIRAGDKFDFGCVGRIVGEGSFFYLQGVEGKPERNFVRDMGSLGACRAVNQLINLATQRNPLTIIIDPVRALTNPNDMITFGE